MAQDAAAGGGVPAPQIELATRLRAAFDAIVPEQAGCVLDVVPDAAPGDRRHEQSDHCWCRPVVEVYRRLHFRNDSTGEEGAS
jgi:hypothetical protein